jgi:hypothetical protein
MLMRATRLLLVAAALMVPAAGCSKRSGGAGRSSSGFDSRWTTLAQQGTEAYYIEDDRGEGFMGNVLRSQTGALAMAPLLPESYKGGGHLPDQPDRDRVQKLVRQYLPGVKSCYLQMSRDGNAPSGKAIVSFQIAGNGRVQALNVDAPAFEGTPLSGCITSQVTRWVFPASRKGLGAMSYPFVFVGS